MSQFDSLDHYPFCLQSYLTPKMGTEESIFGISMEHHFPNLHQSCMHWYNIGILFNLVFGTDPSIGIIFSVVASFVLVFVVITFSLFWLAFRYNIIYVSMSRDETDGLLYPTALNQLFTRIYTIELCIIGLFFLVREENGTYACIGQRTIMIFVTVLTAIFQILVNRKFGPLFHFLPFQKRNPRHQTNFKAANNIRQMPNALDKFLRKSIFNMMKKIKRYAPSCGSFKF